MFVRGKVIFMINFIICDDVKKYREKITHIVDSYMMKNKIEYRNYVFDDYDNRFMKIVESKMPFKIYILDIETPTRSGIDIARVIRKRDVDSVLIFLTGHQELSNLVLKNDFLFLSFINKFDNCEERLSEALDKALKVLKVKSVIRFKDNGILYTIPVDDILYITRDSVERKCIVVTDYSKFKVNKSLTVFEDMLGSDFVKTHRACLMNRRRIMCVNKSKREVIFDNGLKSGLISTRYARELM